MSNILTDRCPRCGEAIDYLEHVQHLQCKCGYEFLVAEFVSERRKMEETAAGKADAEKKLAETQKERSELQSRLNNTLTALEHIEGTQAASDSKLKEILAGMKTDRQAHDAMAELLRAIKADQAAGQDGLTQLLRAVMQDQNTADAKLDAVKQLTGQILAAQEASGSALRMIRRDIEDKIYALNVKADRQEELYQAFFDWNRSIRAEDVQRLKKLQASSDTLLQDQQKMAEKLQGLEQGIKDTKDAVERGFDEQRKWRLDAMIELYHQATELQVAREFDKAEDKYRDLLAKGKEAKCAEVYWRLLMCHYGVEYQEDQGELIPIILRPDLADPEKVSVRKDLEKCEMSQSKRAFYQERLERIDKYLDNYRMLRMREECQYDVFISVKQSDCGHFTTDSDLASDLYDYFKGELGHKHLRVFNSRRCKMELPLGIEFEPYIMTALMSAKLLIVVGSSKEYLDSKWVRSEWQRFQYLQEHDKTKERRLFCYFVNDMKPEQLPRGLNPNAQALMGGVLAGAAITKLVDEIFPSDHPVAAPVQGEPVDKVVSRMGTWLNLRKYEKVVEKYEELENDRPELLQEAPLICIYTLCAQNECRTLDKLSEKRPDIWREPLFELAYENANDDLKRKLDDLKKREAPKPAPQSAAPAAPQSVSRPVQTPVKPAAAPAGNQDDVWQVVMTGCAVDRRLKAIKAVRELLGCSLKEATDMTAGGVHCVAKGVSRAEAERIQKMLADVGVNATIQLPGAAAPKAVPSPVEALRPDWQVLLTGCAADKRLHVIKAVRELRSCSLKEATDMAAGGVHCVAESLPMAEAERIRKLLADAGAEAKIQLAEAKPSKSASQPAPAPSDKPRTTALDTFRKYIIALEGEVGQRKRELTMAEIDAFISKYNLDVKDIGRTEVSRDLEEIYVRLGVKKPAAKQQSAPEQKKIVTSQYTYEGEVLNGKKHGKGRMLWPSGEKYVGDFQDDKMHGTGVYSYKSGNSYEGDWKEGQRTGKGTFCWADGEKYVGEFLNNKMHGKGVYTYKNGNRYEGDWKEDQRTGKGTFYWPDGEKYAGDYLNGKKIGVGTYYFANGDRYEGDWKDDQRTGKGAYFFKNGEKYVGDFVNGKRTGKGTFYWPDGDRYVGEFQEGKYVGNGTFYKANGEVIPYKDGKAAPAAQLKDRKGYLEALEAYVATQKNAHLTADQVDTFWKFRRLHEPNLTREMVESDLQELYRKQSLREAVVKAVGNASAEAKPASSFSQKKERTEAAVAEFWREWLPKVNASALVKPQLKAPDEDAARRAVGIWIPATDNLLGVIHVNHGLFKGNTVLIITKDRMYINVNNKAACPPAMIPFVMLRGAEEVAAANGKSCLLVKTVNGQKEFFVPDNQPRDTLKFGALADALNQFVKTFK